MERIASYISKLNVPSPKFKSLIITKPETEEGLSLDSRNGQVNIAFLVDWRKKSDQEKSIRDYFSKIKIHPNRDYLAGNGDIPDATRVVEYHLSGDDNQITDLVIDILRSICNIKSEDPLNIHYEVT